MKKRTGIVGVLGATALSLCAPQRAMGQVTGPSASSQYTLPTTDKDLPGAVIKFTCDPGSSSAGLVFDNQQAILAQAGQFGGIVELTTSGRTGYCMNDAAEAQLTNACTAARTNAPNAEALFRAYFSGLWKDRSSEFAGYRKSNARVGDLFDCADFSRVSPKPAPQ